MSTKIRSVCAALLALILVAAPARAEYSRDEVRAAYAAVSDASAESPYAEAPLVAAPYGAGALTDAARRDALNMLNFARWLAGLDPVAESRIYNYQCQHGAVLLAALDAIDHNAPQPADMDKNFYDSAHLATTSGNLARFNWMRPSILREGVAYFLRDDGEANLALLGHRRWALNPAMAYTGFGLANSQSGRSYVVMYAHDTGNAEADWDAVCWPSAGAFPAELMHADLAWSVTLNPDVYDLDRSTIAVTLSEAGSGLRFAFAPGDGDCLINADGYGGGPCLIVRPDFSATAFADYEQNQRWTVHVTGLTRRDGETATLEYAVDMISLHVEDVANLEVSLLEARLVTGETLRLSAAVIPAYADDLSVQWLSSDESVARVDADGLVTALRPGQCQIIAHSANGRSDACALTVSAAEPSN